MGICHSATVHPRSSVCSLCSYSTLCYACTEQQGKGSEVNSAATLLSAPQQTMKHTGLNTSSGEVGRASLALHLDVASDLQAI